MGRTHVARRKRANGAGSVSKRKDGQWWARLSYRTADGTRKRLVKYARTQVEAEQKLAEMQQELVVSQMNGIAMETTTVQIYFIQPVGGGPIKIGASENVWQRFCNIQSCSPVILKIVGVLADQTYSVEKKLHHRFQSDRIHGEWFHPSPDLLNFIRAEATEFSS